MPGEPLFTERLRLEYLDVAHAHALLAYVARNDEHVRPWMPTHPPKETTEASIRDAIERAQIGRSRGELVRFVAFERDGDDIVGSIDLLSILRGIVQSAMLGYSVDATREGRGYATEGARAVVRYAFDELNLHRVEASYRPTNERSGRVLRKLGFVVEGYARDYLFLNDAWRDGILVSLTNARWRPA